MSASFKSSRVSAPGTIFTNGFVWSYRTRAPVGNLKADGLRTQSRRASAVFPSVAGSLGNGRLLTARIERTRTHPALLAVSNFHQGTRWIKNLCRAFKAAGKPSRFPLVNGSAKPTNGVSNRFSLSPVLSSACLHANNKAWSSQHDAQRNPASRASGASSYE